MSAQTICEWIEATPMGVFVRESSWGFPMLVAIHIMGLGASAGLVAWFDLRLLGVTMRRVPVSKVYRQLMPWAGLGFLVMFTSGACLLSGFATSAYGNPYFRLKMAALVLAGVNALVYHRVTESSRAEWDVDHRPPSGARMAGFISLALWATVIVAGRMVAYTLYSR